jgi:hypothetical protein
MFYVRQGFYRFSIVKFEIINTGNLQSEFPVFITKNEQLGNRPVTYASSDQHLAKNYQLMAKGCISASYN